MLLPDLPLEHTGQTELYTIAERIRRRVSELSVVVDTPDGPLTIGGLSISVGGATYPTDGASLEQVMQAANAALSAAKRAGRNVVRGFGSTPPPGPRRLPLSRGHGGWKAHRSRVRRLIPCPCCDPSAVRSTSTLCPGPTHHPGPEIREFLVAKVSRTGGHLGPNLGVVELPSPCTASSSPPGPIVFDTGHQAYVHKMLTGRQEGSTRSARRAACRATPARPSRARRGRELATPPRRSPTPTAWPRPTACVGRSGTSSRSSATARSPAVCAGRR